MRWLEPAGQAESSAGGSATCEPPGSSGAAGCWAACSSCWIWSSSGESSSASWKSLEGRAPALPASPGPPEPVRPPVLLSAGKGRGQISSMPQCGTLPARTAAWRAEARPAQHPHTSCWDIHIWMLYILIRGKQSKMFRIAEVASFDEAKDVDKCGDGMLQGCSLRACFSL